MNVMALLLQANNLWAKAKTYTPGSVSSFSRVIIALFVIGLAVAIGIGIYMVFRGCKGAFWRRKEKS